jgi:integrase
MRDLRHYFAVQNLMRGVPITVVSAWMGHSRALASAPLPSAGQARDAPLGFRRARFAK